MPGDAELIQIVDAAMAEAARQAGSWLVCRPGCADCCLGEFSISELDARRLRRGLAALQAIDPDRAQRVRRRAAFSAGRDLADDEPCPALDPESRTCDLYAFRPITCRTFGPPVRTGDVEVGVCELCFEGATDDQIAACEVEVDPEGLEAILLAEAGPAETTVALALYNPIQESLPAHPSF